MKLKIGIVDYGIGNLSSITKSLLSLGFKVKLSYNHFELRESDLILLPGVGAFKPAMIAIKDKGLDEFLLEMVTIKKPIIGICLGMQLLGRSSTENEFTEGLNLIPEDVCALPENNCHIGWNSIKIVSKDDSIKIFDSEYYFNHSFAFPPESKYSICETNFKGINFTSVIKKEKVLGLQFHPERSQKIGLKLLQHLVKDLCENA